MQLYNRGIRRRLAPMLGDWRLINLAYSVLFSLPGMPVIRYGEEIGMGDDLSLNERLSVRTPMQWSDAPNAGFSTTAKTVRPAISQGPYCYSKVNVAAQRSDSTSLLNQISRLARLRKQYPEIGWGNWQILDTGSPHVLAIRYDWQGRSLLIVHNFSPKPQLCQLSGTLKTDTKLIRLLADSLGRQSQPRNDRTIQLAGYGYGWYRLTL